VKKKEQHTIVVVDDRVGDQRSKQIDLDGDGGAAGGEGKVHGTLAKWRDTGKEVVRTRKQSRRLKR
jgi:hypothetical protein